MKNRMNFRNLTALLVFAFVLSAKADPTPIEPFKVPESYGCSIEPSENVSFREIILDQRAREPSFYYISSVYVVFIRPSDLISHLKSQLVKYANAGTYYDLLLQKIKADVPIKQDTHIEKYVLQNSNFVNEISDVIFHLLNEGKVAVYDLHNSPKAPLKRVRAVDNRNGDWVTRFYCTLEGQTFFNHLAGSPSIQIPASVTISKGRPSE